MTLDRLSLALHIGKSTPAKAKDALLKALQTVEVRQADDSSDAYRQGFQLTFNAQRKNGAAPDYAVLSSPDLKLGNRVIVVVTLDGKPSVLMDGIITYQHLSFSAGSREPSLIVMGKDLSVLMDLEEKREGYSGTKPKDVVQKIIKNYAKHGMQAKITAPATEWPIKPKEHIPFQAGTDLQYLRGLAAANGYIFTVQAGPHPQKSVAYWGPPSRKGQAQPALSYSTTGNSNIESIEFAYDGLAPAKGKRARAGDQLSVEEVSASKIKPELAKDVPLDKNGTLTRTRWLTVTGPDDGEAAARLQGLVDLGNEQVVVATGKLNALAYGHVLHAPGIVGVRGVGTTYDGEYYVKAVKHIIGRGQYSQEFTLTREGVTAAKQKLAL